MTDTTHSSPLQRFLRYAGVFLGVTLAAAAVLFVAAFSLVGNMYGPQILGLLVTGLVGGGLIRSLLPEARVTIVFVLVVAAECVLLSQLSDPWPRLWVVLIPANALGLMAGNTIRLGLNVSRAAPTRDVWMLNGSDYSRTNEARAAALAALAGWDSAVSGPLRVQRLDSLFEAMGDARTGFVVHCTPSFREDAEWRVLGMTTGPDETEIRIPSGPAFAPSGAVVELETAQRALLGFFHYRGPDPDLAWTDGPDVLDLKFG